MRRKAAARVVRSVESGSAAAQAGLRTNDIIIGVNRGKVTNLQQLRERAKGASTLVLEVRRGNTILLVPLRSADAHRGETAAHGRRSWP